MKRKRKSLSYASPQEAPKASDGTYLVKAGNPGGPSTADQPDGKEPTEEIQEQYNKIIMQNREERKALQKKYKVKGGIKFEINDLITEEEMTDGPTAEDHSRDDVEETDPLNDTLTFDHGMKLEGVKWHEMHEDPGQSDNGNLDDIPQNRKQWTARAPQTLIGNLLAAGMTSMCDTVAEDDDDDDDTPVNRKQWKQEAPGTLMRILGEVDMNDSILPTKDLRAGTLKKWPPEQAEKEATEQTSEEDLDEERFEPRSDDEDTTFEESEEELEVIEILEKVLAFRDENDDNQTNEDPTMRRSSDNHQNADNPDPVQVDQSESEQAIMKSNHEDQTTAGKQSEISVVTNQTTEEVKEEAQSQLCAPESTGNLSKRGEVLVAQAVRKEEHHGISIMYNISIAYGIISKCVRFSNMDVSGALVTPNTLLDSVKVKEKSVHESALSAGPTHACTL
ncbi:PREDICTED: serine/threonine-protein kinase Nek5 [Nanorana parkeri]|uniref:serine/threonine-protein kinase Nek5 n=1 Tax=Nanorana parkeri TaxID=125878 RepID=UPI0008548981|nr:PREDICTED: serine/threonine-protein kinase Nek5 [Nanorana parkeri]